VTSFCKPEFALTLAAMLLVASSAAFAGNSGKHVTMGSKLQAGTTTSGTDICKRNPSNRHCNPYPGPGSTQPTCKGPHKGPNGVMIQCD